MEKPVLQAGIFRDKRRMSLEMGSTKPFRVGNRLFGGPEVGRLPETTEEGVIEGGRQGCVLEEGKLLLLTAEEVRLVLTGHQEPPSRVSAWGRGGGGVDTQ